MGRGHLIELGCIVCDELADLGAGKEGWLAEKSDTLCALDSELLALATRSILLIIGWPASPDSRPSPVKIIPELSTPEAITAIEWIVYDEIRVIAVGTSFGWLILYTIGGDLVHRQMIHHAMILNLRVRGMKCHATQEHASELCIIMPGIIARIDGSNIQVMLQRWFEEMNVNVGNKMRKSIDVENSGISDGRLIYQIWNINKYGPCVDAAIMGIMPPPLLEFESSQRYYCAISIGNDAVISAFRLSEDRNRSLVGAIFSKVVPITFSAISSVSKLFWRKKSSQESKSMPQTYAQACALTCLKDNHRKGEKLAMLPNGTLAAVTDSLGRVLLLDTRALVVVRLWKGYRDATCIFVEMQRQTSESHSDSGKGAHCLCLAIHAPKKGIVEVWEMRTGPRLLTIQCPRGSRILQPPCKFTSSTESSSRSPLELFLLNGDSGQISLLNQAI